VSPGRGTAVGLGPGAEVGAVELTVTREFGAVPVLERSVEASESDTVMRVLEGSAEIATRYGGGYVRSIEGTAETERGGDPYDWFFFVNGVESPIGAAEYELRGGERIWWDYRDWIASNHVPAVVGSWPAPLVGGYEGEGHPVALVCAGGGPACARVRAALRREGVELAEEAGGRAIRVLVGPWARLREDPAAALLEAGPEESGVYAEFEPGGGGDAGGGTGGAGAGYSLVALDVAGEPARELGPGAGLLAATRRYEAPPTWLVTGGSAAAVSAAAELLGREHLRDRYAVAAAGGEELALPLGAAR
jgi:hypothetical protein